MKAPDNIAACARRLAAKMIADQAVRCMASIVAIENTGAGPHEDVATDLASDDLTVVVVATGRDARRVLAWLEGVSKFRSIEAEQ